MLPGSPTRPTRISSHFECEFQAGPPSAPGSRTHTPLPPSEREVLVMTPTRKERWEELKGKINHLKLTRTREEAVATLKALAGPSGGEPSSAPAAGAGPATASGLLQTGLEGRPPFHPPAATAVSSLVLPPPLLAESDVVRARLTTLIGSEIEAAIRAGNTPPASSKEKPSNSSWIIPDLLLMGGYPLSLGNPREDANRYGLKTIVKVCEGNVTRPGKRILLQHIKRLFDFCIGGTPIFPELEMLTDGKVEEVFVEIAKGLIEGDLTYIHCVNGESRSGSMTAAFMMWLYRLEPAVALKYVTACRPKTNQGILADLGKFHAYFCSKK